MKIFVEISVESVNFAATAVGESVGDVIMNYVALMTISELDEIYYTTIKSSLKDELEDRDFELPIRNFSRGMVQTKFHCVDKFLLWIVSVI